MQFFYYYISYLKNSGSIGIACEGVRVKERDINTGCSGNAGLAVMLQ